jgi:hypothetical protein
MQQLSAPSAKSITQKALELNLVPPKFNHDKPSVGKTILGNKLVKNLTILYNNQPIK